MADITDIIPDIKTDHAAISIEFCNRSNDTKGPGYWKMNCSLLDDGVTHCRTIKAFGIG